MDYTQSNSFVVDAGTGYRRHEDNQAVPTLVSEKDMNQTIWSLMELLKAAGILGAQFDETVPATYQKVRDAINVMVRLQSGGVATATGTADALVGAFNPAVPTLANGLTLYLRASGTNTSTTPTFTPAAGVLAAKIIVKGNGLALLPGDIAGAGHWIEVQYDSALDKWVLLNPSQGVKPALGVGQTFQDVTASRATGTIFTNSSGRPIFVNVNGQITTNSPSTALVTINGVSFYGTTTGLQSGNSTATSFIVPTGATYSVDFAGGAPALTKWLELR